VDNSAVFEDAFNMLCGKKLGEGVHREVFECRIRPDLVCKVERGDARFFANILEDRFYNLCYFKPAAIKWLAPCEYLSPDGRILLQRRADPIRSTDKLPDKLPTFLDDIKRENFGYIDGNLVCVDYAFYKEYMDTKLRKVTW
jgi:hypothetical protein